MLSGRFRASIRTSMNGYRAARSQSTSPTVNATVAANSSQFGWIRFPQNNNAQVIVLADLNMRHFSCAPVRCDLLSYQ
jgi:hypothetical protein